MFGWLRKSKEAVATETVENKEDYSNGYDPLDDSLLTDPVDLEINHPDKGRMVLKVNRWNAEKYLKYGPSVFPRRTRDSGDSSRRYSVKDDSSDNGGLDLIDYIILYELFFSHSDNGGGGSFYEPSFVGAGGDFGGAGASGDWTQDSVAPLIADPFSTQTAESDSPASSEEKVTEESGHDEPPTDASPATSY